MNNSLKVLLRALRKERKLTQEEIALLLCMPRGTYIHYELGKREPDLGILMRIADFHRVSLDYLAGYTDYRPTEAEWLAIHPGSASEKRLPSSYRLSRRTKTDKDNLKIADDTNVPSTDT